MIDDPRQGAFPWRTVPVRAYERQRFGACLCPLPEPAEALTTPRRVYEIDPGTWAASAALFLYVSCRATHQT